MAEESISNAQMKHKNNVNAWLSFYLNRDSELTTN
jgi:hypothetical protein